MNESEQQIMPPTTLAALQDSIKHWERLATGTAGAGEWIYTDDCALCALFNNNQTPGDMKCVGCPVFARSGRVNCGGTPWKGVAIVWGRLRANWHFHSEIRADSSFQAAAKVELEFLKSLLPAVDSQKEANARKHLKSIFLPPGVQMRLHTEFGVVPRMLPEQTAGAIEELWTQRNKCDEYQIDDLDNRMYELVASETRRLKAPGAVL